MYKKSFLFFAAISTLALGLDARTVIIHFSNNSEEYVGIASSFLRSMEVGPLFLPGLWEKHTMQFNTGDGLLFEDSGVYYKTSEIAGQQEYSFRSESPSDPLMFTYRYVLNDDGELALNILELTE